MNHHLDLRTASYRCVAVWLGAGSVVLFGVLLLIADTWPAKFVSRIDEPERSDAIVVLGGLAAPRAETAARLYHGEFAPRIFVTGRGDAETVRKQLVALGVPENVVTLENVSASTYENARFTIPLLRRANVHRALLVTSWFHSRRAHRCFRQAAPEIEFRVVAPESHQNQEEYEIEYARAEVWKLVYYFVRYGVIDRGGIERAGKG